MKVSTTIDLEENCVRATKGNKEWRFSIHKEDNSSCIYNFSPKEVSAISKGIQSLLKKIKGIDSGKTELELGANYSTSTWNVCLHLEHLSITIPKRFWGKRTIKICKECGTYDN